WLSSIQRQETRRPRWLAVTHMFNHQTHHRGQVHALLTGLGARPEDTDLIFMQLPA
ncbi:DinB family protein, partial [Rhodoblastus sp.]